MNILLGRDGTVDSNSIYTNTKTNLLLAILICKSVCFCFLFEVSVVKRDKTEWYIVIRAEPGDKVIALCSVDVLLNA